jgi:uncharacterized protein
VRSWVLEALAAHPEWNASPVLVPESAAEALAQTEADKEAAPELPATARVAASIGRFVQDPLAEALRWDVCEIPLGPNQRDLDQGELRRRLEEVAQACVADVGVDLNEASATLLTHVPGLDAALAARIVSARTANGPFAARTDLRRVEGMPEQAWQRAAGFLRIKGGVDPIDATGVHPTGAVVVSAIAAKLSLEPGAVVGRSDLLAPLDPAEFAGQALTEGDVRSVIEELGRDQQDPRGKFVPPAFNPGAVRPRDLREGMELDGVVTRISRFGAFVDVGVRQDGLVHVSELAHGFVRDPGEVVSVGLRVRVKVMSVDSARRRISLSIKALLPAPEPPAPPPGAERPQWGRRAPGRGERDGARGHPAREGSAVGPGVRPSRRGRPQDAPALEDGRSGGRAPREGRGRGSAPGAGFAPERPGTAPRRAMRRDRGRPGAAAAGSEEMDLSRDGGAGFRDLGGRGRDRGRFERAPRQSPRHHESPRDGDPFQRQLAALREKLGLAVPPSAPATLSETSPPEKPSEQTAGGETSPQPR